MVVVEKATKAIKEALNNEALMSLDDERLNEVINERSKAINENSKVRVMTLHNEKSCHLHLSREKMYR